MVWFEWDNQKAQINSSKHGVNFHEAKTVFEDPFTLTILDPDHSFDETRYIEIGYSTRNRLLVVVYTERLDVIRIISCREANKNERRQYENEK